MRVGISSEKKGCESGERGGVRVRRKGVRIGREREGCETGACKGGKMEVVRAGRKGRMSD